MTALTEHPHWHEAELAIIRDPSFGYDADFRHVRLVFHVKMKDRLGGAQLSFTGEDVETILRDARAQDVRQLEGMPCYIWIEGSGLALVHFLGIAQDI